MVKNLLTTKGTLLALLLSPMIAQAASDEYPAADFQPKVLYSDSGYKHTESAPSSSSASKTAFDPNYPAAAFEPKVLYKDSNYKHKADKVAATSSRKATQAASSASASEGVSAKEESDQTLLIGVVVLAVLGFFFYRKNAGSSEAPKTTRRSAPAQSRSSAVVSAAEGATRVEQYLAKKQPQVTSVDKYLQSKEQSAPTTGVAKYLAKQVVRARKMAEENATGVEKYLRKKKG